MVEYRAPFSHWSDFTFAELADYTFEWLAEPSNLQELAADIVLAPLTESSAGANHIITAFLAAYAKQFAYIYELTYKMGLARRIEFVTGTDLDNSWGRTYKVKRFYGESDDDYRKRLQVYLLQVAGSGTKSAIENIISIIVEQENACRVDTYWPGYCRIYLTDARALAKARERLDLINLVLPDTLAAGVDYRFYIPYHELTADMALHGPVYNSLPASMVLIDGAQVTLEASIYLNARTSVLLDAELVLASMPQSLLKAYMALRDRAAADLPATMALSDEVQSEFDATEALQGPVETTFRAYERLLSDAQSEFDADIALQDKRLRPVEARMMLEAAT